MDIGKILVRLFGDKKSRDLKAYKPLVDAVLEKYPAIDALSHDELRARVQEIRAQIAEKAADLRAQIAEIKSRIPQTEIQDRAPLFHEIDKLEKDVLEILEKELDEVRPEVFAIVKSTARRFTESEEVRVKATQFDRDLAAKHDFVDIDGDTAVYHNHWIAGGNETVWAMVHFDVQLFGGTVLHQGKIAEMFTGEGKTLTATLPVFLNALTGNGVHVVTVNDYLAKRDSEWMGPIYMFHGLSVDCIDKHEPNSEARRQAYLADITFGTNNEFGFDYLRDNMAQDPRDLVQRGHNYAIVDEVDSVLIDDARTPLIISGPVPKGDDQMFEEYQPLVERLVGVQRTLATQYLAEAKKLIGEGTEKNDKNLTAEGFLSLFRSFKALPKNKALIKYLSEPGIKAGLLSTEDIYMENNNRRMPEAVEPLYFVVDEKMNSVDLTDKGNEWLASQVKDEALFVLPDIAGMMSQIEADKTLDDETRIQKKDEIYTDYALKSERVHTLQQLLKAYTMFNINDEYVIQDGEVKVIGDRETVAEQYTLLNLEAERKEEAARNKRVAAGEGYPNGLNARCPLLRTFAVSKPMLTSDETFRFGVEYQYDEPGEFYLAIALHDIRRGGITFDTGAKNPDFRMTKHGHHTVYFEMPMHLFNNGEFRLFTSLRTPMASDPDNTDMVAVALDENACTFVVRDPRNADYALINNRSLAITPISEEEAKRG